MSHPSPLPCNLNMSSGISSPSNGWVVRGMPDKLMAIILSLAIEEPVILPPYPRTRRQDLRTVCKTWRRVIDTSELLWSNAIFLPVEVPDPNELLQFATRWISRTSGTPITIKLDGNFPFANPGRQATHTKQMMYGGGHFCIVSRIILPSANRITSLTCTICTDATIRAFLSIPASTFAILQHLDVVMVNQFESTASGFDAAEVKSFQVFRGTTALRHLALHFINIMNPLFLHIPWTQLTTVDLATRAIPPEIFRTILRRSNSLVEGSFLVKFTARGPGIPSRKIPSRVTVPSLKTLVLCVVEPSNDPIMLERIVAPELVDLRIELNDPVPGWMLGHYTSILNKAAKLERITLAPHAPRVRIVGGIDERILLHRNIPHNEMLEFLSAMPHIKSIHLPLAIPLGIPILDDMANGNYVPHLEELLVGCRRGYSFSVLSMIQRRNELLTNPRALSNRSAGGSAAVGGSTKVVITPLSQITFLTLLVEQDEQEEMKTEVSLIKLHGLWVNTEIKVEGREARLFYHPK